MKNAETMQNEIKSLSRRLKTVYLIFGGLLVLQTAFFLGTKTEANGDNENQIVRTRGIVIVDEQGRERVLIGAPIPASKDRVFTDKSKALAAWKDKMPESAKFYWGKFNELHKDAVGMIVLDENGFDRVAVGDQLPDANTGKRIGSPTGITIHNEKGYERAGFGTIKVGDTTQVGLGMDAEYGEALNLFAIKGFGVGLRINDSKNQAIFGTLEPNKLNNKSDQPFTAYIFSQGNEVKHQFNVLQIK